MQSKNLKILSYGAMAAVIVMMVAGTVVERLHGAAAAQAVYHHPVFLAMWAVVAIAGMALLLRGGAGRRPAVLALHVALVLMLAGALVTHLSGENGRIHLRTGEAVASFAKA